MNSATRRYEKISGIISTSFTKAPASCFASMAFLPSSWSHILAFLSPPLVEPGFYRPMRSSCDNATHPESPQLLSHWRNACTQCAAAQTMESRLYLQLSTPRWSSRSAPPNAGPKHHISAWCPCHNEQHRNRDFLSYLEEHNSYRVNKRETKIEWMWDHTCLNWGTSAVLTRSDRNSPWSAPVQPFAT